jgi:hypothetical protein
VSILLRADPAVGKSYLAKKLRDAIDFPLVSHDISQLDASKNRLRLRLRADSLLV